MIDVRFADTCVRCGVAVLATLAFTAGCASDSHQSGNSPASDSQQGADPASPSSMPNSQPSEPKKVTGIVFITTGTGKPCDVQAIDPQSGVITSVSSFNVQNCPVDIDSGSAHFTQNFDRIIATQDEVGHRAGWIDNSGVKTLIGPPSATPNFGVTTSVSSEGFDKDDNFYYSITYINAPGGTYEEFYKVPAGSTSNGELVGTLKPNEKRKFGRLPGGQFGLDAQVDLGASCDMSFDQVDGPFDPDRQVYYHAGDGVINKSGDWCTSGGTPITPHANNGASGPVVSPDGKQIAFQSGNQLYLASATGTSAPTLVNMPVVPEQYGWRLRKWA